MAPRLEAPRESGQTLCQPERRESAELVRCTVARVAGEAGRVGGLPFDEWRSAARRSALRLAVEYSDRFGPTLRRADDGPLIVTGHQPDLYHPGVWIKNFAVCGLARRIG